MPGIFPILGHTEEAAQTKFQELQELILPSVGLKILSSYLGGFDLTPYPLDGPLPDIDIPETNAVKSRFELVLNLARREKLTIRQLYQYIAGSRGHHIFVGTPAQLADKMEEWFLQKGCDGFNLMPPLLPEGLDVFVDEVVPLLQERGLFRTEYVGNTLREHLGLQRPANRYSSQQSEGHVSI